MNNIHQLDDEWKEIAETDNGPPQELEEEARQLCVLCNWYQVHDGCFYCEECCGDDIFGLLGPQA